MIEVSTTGFALLARRLANRARAVALAHAENKLRERQHDPWRWRDARLLWPEFTPDFTGERR